MIESLAKASEVLDKAKEFNSNFDPDKEVRKGETFDSKKEYNPDDEVEKEKLGGRYKDLRDAGHGWNHEPPQEVHHMPADSTYDLPRDDKPAIVMEMKEHHQTASWGSSWDAIEYRDEQKRLIDNGQFREALQMDIDDIHDKFGNKYDSAIKDMEEYIKKLEENGNV